MAPVGGQRSAFEDGAAGPDQAGDRRDALSQGGRAVRPRESLAAVLATCHPPRRRPKAAAGRETSAGRETGGGGLTDCPQLGSQDPASP